MANLMLNATTNGTKPDGREKPSTIIEDRVSPDEVDNILKRLPRFLFRVWSSKSGGDARLNTTEAVTPHAFLDEPFVDSCYNTSCQTLTHLVNNHLTGIHSRQCILHVRIDGPGIKTGLNHVLDVYAAQKARFTSNISR